MINEVMSALSIIGN